MLYVVCILLACSLPSRALSAGNDDLTDTSKVQAAWYHLILDLVRHTPTYSPPVAARAFAYLGVTAYEVTASGPAGLISLSGQLNALPEMPHRNARQTYDEAVVLDAALEDATRRWFGNTGPTGQRAMLALSTRLSDAVAQRVDPDVLARSLAYGRAVAGAVHQWSVGDGADQIENMGFPDHWTFKPGPAHWRPTSKVALQQAPLLPNWGDMRTFATPNGGACPLPPPPEYSEAQDSEFFRQALEVHDVVRNLSPEREAIARFWSDDPMLSPTPPGHWISIALLALEHEHAGIARRVEAMVRLGVASADAFIGCWHAKFEVDLVRPVTYIRKVIDPDWEPLLITPPFPEYPSGHSVLSGAAAEVLSTLFGDAYGFDDTTHARDDLPPRHFASFRDAAREAGISRQYGGIHFRAAIERGLEQGRCIAAHAIALKVRP